MTQEREREYFDAPFMQKLEKGATSEKYFESVVQDVPLHQIRKVVDSCYFDKEMKTAAILSEIAPTFGISDDVRQNLRQLRTLYGDVEKKDGSKTEYRYLLEVWNEGELIYQEALKQKVVRWNMSR